MGPAHEITVTLPVWVNVGLDALYIDVEGSKLDDIERWAASIVARCQRERSRRCDRSVRAAL